MNALTVRQASSTDLPPLEVIENRCFSGSRRSSRRSLARSLRSPSQSVWLTVCEDQPVGAMILHHHRRSLRIYSLAVLPRFRHSGAGRCLLLQALAIARASGRQTISLEADRRNKVLTDWYEQFGFKTTQILKDYYSPGRHAVRMRLTLKEEAPDGNA